MRKTSYSFNDFKQRQAMTLSCSQKTISIIILQSKNYQYYYKELRAITSKHHGDFYCLNCLHSFATENKLQSHKKVCENKGFCNIIMSSEDTKIFKFNQYQKIHLQQK